MTEKFLFKPVDNTGLVLFRIFLGVLIMAEAIGAISIGWVHYVYIEPTVHFPFIGFEWLIDLFAGETMLIIYSLMAICGFTIAIGFNYRTSAFLFALLWTCSYLMQKVHYNNHHYLMVLIGWIMPFVPANARLSVDARKKPSIHKFTCHNFYFVLFIGLLWILYSYASFNKIHADWLEGRPIRVWFGYKGDYRIVGPLLQESWFQKMVVYGGILFDGLVIPMLLWKRTRTYAFIIGVGFHLFNSIVFQIGVFPYLAIAFTTLFFSATELRDFFVMKKWDKNYDKEKVKNEVLEVPKHASLMQGSLYLFFIIMFLLPLRHNLFPGPVNWNEQGHRLSWRMMLRAKGGDVYFKIYYPKTEEFIVIKPEDEVNFSTANDIATHPDLCWQYVQVLKKREYEKGHLDEDFMIFAYSSVRLNGRVGMPLYNSKYDMSKAKWEPFRHSEWLMPFE